MNQFLKSKDVLTLKISWTKRNYFPALWRVFVRASS